MIPKTFFTMVTVVLLAFARVAVADLIGINDPSIVGNGMLSQDGFNLTRDTDTDLEWLDLTLSLNRSFNNVSTQFGAGGDYDGFRFGTGPELVTLFSHAGLTLEDPGPAVTLPILDFLALFGSEPAFGRGDTSAGLYDDTVDGMDPDLVGVARVADFPGGPPGDQVLVRIRPDSTAFGGRDSSEPFGGAWLVRPFFGALDCNGDGIVDVHDADCATSETLKATLETAGLLHGDVDGDGQVQFSDFLTLSANFGEKGAYTQGDFDKDGMVQFSDFLILADNFGQQATVAASVPEPTSALLLLLGTVALRVRQNVASKKRGSRLVVAA